METASALQVVSRVIDNFFNTPAVKSDHDVVEIAWQTLVAVIGTAEAHICVPPEPEEADAVS